MHLLVATCAYPVMGPGNIIVCREQFLSFGEDPESRGRVKPLAISTNEQLTPIWPCFWLSDNPIARSHMDH